MERLNPIYLLLAALAVVLVGFYSVDINSDEANVASLPDFTSTTEVKPADEQPVRNLKDFNDAIVNVVDATVPTVVTIRVTQMVEVPESPFSRFFGNPRSDEPRERLRQGLGSGVIVSEDGYILTNNHVVEGADEIMVDLKNGKTFEGEIIGRDPMTDIAVIKIDANNLHALPIGNSDEIRIGELVLAIGSPLGNNLAHSVSMGIISAKRRTIGIIESGFGYENFLQTDAAINPGNSGGPLVNMNGELVGINTAIASRSGGSDGVGFAIPSNLAKQVMKSLIETGKVVRAYLGIIGDDIDRDLARGLGLDGTQGIIIETVQDDTPASRAGLKQNDIIKTINGEPIQSYASFRTKIATSDPGDQVTLGVIRDGESMEIEVALGELDQDQMASVKDSDEEMQKNLGFHADELTDRIARELDLEPGQQGIVVTDVQRGSNAYRKGLRRGDVITMADQKEVESLSDFREIVNNLADEKNPVLVLRVIKQPGVSQLIAFEL